MCLSNKIQKIVFTPPVGKTNVYSSSCVHSKQRQKCV